MRVVNLDSYYLHKVIPSSLVSPQGLKRVQKIGDDIFFFTFLYIILMSLFTAGIATYGHLSTLVYNFIRGDRDEKLDRGEKLMTTTSMHHIYNHLSQPRGI
jgi:hypothetical protein